MQQKYHWDLSIHGEVETLFLERVKFRIQGVVGEWKKAWKKDGDEAKPLHMDKAVWDGLVRYWMDPKSIITAEKCSASRNTVDSDGRLKALPHTAGQTPFAGVRLQMVIKFI